MQVFVIPENKTTTVKCSTSAHIQTVLQTIL